MAANTVDKAVEFMTVAPPAAIIAGESINCQALLSRLSMDPRFFDIPLIVLSWWPNEDLEARVRRGEFFAFIRKPFDVTAFYSIVQSAADTGPRRNLRIATHLMVRIEDGLEGCEGYATVISEHGMFFRTLDPRPVAARIRISIEIKQKTIRLEAEVLYAITFDEGPFKEPGMGLKFVKINREDRDLIAGFIRDQIVQGIDRQGPPEAV
jgi:hypothetical protein